MQNKNCAGLSIVEALVTMVILLITLGGVYQIFQSNSLTYRMQEGLARVQENGRFAMDFLVNDIRMAGYIGCIGRANLDIHIESNDYVYSFDDAIHGFDADNILTYPISFSSSSSWSNDIENEKTISSISSFLGITYVNNSNEILSGSDLIVIRKAESQGIEIIKDPTLPAETMKITTGNDFEKCEILIVTDCEHASILQNTKSGSDTAGQITHNSGVCSPGNKNEDLVKKYEEGEVLRIYTVVYFLYLKKYEISPGNYINSYSLYRKVGLSDAQELVEGIENLQILYGEDTNQDNNVDTYVNATSVTDWDNVRSVKIGLLVSTVEEIRGMDENIETYNVLGTTIGPANDRRIRRVFTATVGLRNRLK
jgi:type IV pilus assembly protein PilW